MIRAYSYIRFSTPEQFKGDSFRRQTAQAKEYADSNGLLLQDFCYKDLGVSGFKGANLKSGALGQFKEQVRKGVVPKDSWLLIEAWDRFSRMHPKDALREMLELLSLGITIVTLIDGAIYKEDELDTMNLLVCLMLMSRAHEESATKSKRIESAAQKRRDKAREEGARFTKICPLWIELSEDEKSFSLNESKAQTVRDIFKWSIEGLGRTAISRRLVEQGVAPFSKTARTWHTSYVEKILKNPAAYGAIQFHTGSGAKRVPDGEPIENYFPAAIDKDTFLAAQYKSSERRISPNKTTYRGKAKLFSELLYCSCGDKMMYVNNGRGLVYYKCFNVKEKRGCTRRNFKQGNTDELLVSALFQFGSRLLAKDTQEAYDFSVELSSIKGQLEEVQNKISVAVEHLLTNPSPAISSRLRELESEESQLKEDIKAKEAMSALQAVHTNSAQELEDILEGLSATVTGDDEDKRIDLALGIKQLVSSVTFDDRYITLKLKQAVPKFFEDEQERNSLVLQCTDTKGLQWEVENLEVELDAPVFTMKRKKKEA